MSTPHQPDADDTQVIREHTTVSPRGVDPTLVVAAVAGVLALFMLVVGLVALARTGLSADLTASTTTVGPYDRSTLMAIIEILGGLSLAGIAVSRRSASLTGFGLLATVFGLVWLIEPHAFGDALGVDRQTAWTYLLFGLGSVGVGFWAPDRVVREVGRTL